jgi:hypothetical protein
MLAYYIVICISNNLLCKKGLIMKKILLSALVSLGFVVAVPISASAMSPSTMVSGTVKSGSTALAGANVSVTCNGNVQTDTTDASGGYLVGFAASDCPAGSVAHAVATSGSQSGTGSGAVKQDGSDKLNVAVADVNVGLPEMGTLVGGVAAIGAGGAFMVTRRKQQIEQS